MKKSLSVLMLLILAGAAVDSSIYQHRNRQLVHSVSQLGGRCGSIGGWPTGTEYRVLFENRAFTDDEWSQLNALRDSQPQPRMSVLMIALTDCELAAEQIEDAQRRFHVIEE